MADPIVPASTAIRRSRVANIDTDRLTRRQAWLVPHLADTHNFEKRSDFVNRARELFAVENELDARGVAYQRRTSPTMYT